MDTETDTRRGKMIQRDTGRRWPYTSQGENARTDLSFPHSPQEESTLLTHFCCLSHSFCGTLLHRLSKLIQPGRVHQLFLIIFRLHDVQWTIRE